jgi:hypothetical protein
MATRTFRERRAVRIGPFAAYDHVFFERDHFFGFRADPWEPATELSIRATRVLDSEPWSVVDDEGEHGYVSPWRYVAKPALPTGARIGSATRSIASSSRDVRCAECRSTSFTPSAPR